MNQACAYQTCRKTMQLIHPVIVAVGLFKQREECARPG